jgi:type I restriction enzyme, S subunit
MIFNSSKFNSAWDEYPLFKLGKFKRGISKHRPRNDPKLFSNGTFPLIQTGEIKEAILFVNSYKLKYNDIGLKQSKLWDKGTLCITIAANIAETAILAYPMCFPDSCVGFNAYPNKTSEIFMHYVFTYIKKSIQSTALGSIQDNINIEILTDLIFKIPKKPIQDNITDLLSSIDNKMELNNRIISKLEQKAKTLYNFWFTQFDFANEDGKPYKMTGGRMQYNEILRKEIPFNWKVKDLNKMGKFKNGINYEANGRGEELVKIVNVRDISNSKYFVFKETLDSIKLPEKEIKKYLMTTSDILIARSSSPGATRLIHGDVGNIIFSGFIINYRVDNLNYKNVLFFRLKEIEYALSRKSGGTIFKNVTQDTLKIIDVAVPPEPIVKKFNTLVNPLIECIYNISKQNQELINLRDFLLPLLMTGQVKVK